MDEHDFAGTFITHIPCLQPDDIPQAFRVGVIVEDSGCGKTSSDSSGERLFGRVKPLRWHSERRIAAHFSSMDALAALFCAAQLWLDLSLGEQHRVDIARQLDAYDAIVIDELTSYIDCKTAMRLAKGVGEYIARHELRGVVMLSCKWGSNAIIQRQLREKETGRGRG